MAADLQMAAMTNGARFAAGLGLGARRFTGLGFGFIPPHSWVGVSLNDPHGFADTPVALSATPSGLLRSVDFATGPNAAGPWSPV